MGGYPQFSFWILITLAKICFFPRSHKPPKDIVVLGGKFLKKPEYPEMRRASLVTGPLCGSEVGVDLVLIKFLLLFTCKSCSSDAN